ncbi:MAG TPA: LamG-like jellyroll fold domain-containing protein [Gemmataceae bacterium]|nr:LamG-like jellyroll fold domain-containing protein [Gemmataceae bacterium]
MSRSFNGTSDYLNSSGAVEVHAFSAITVAFWLWWNSFANDDHLCMESSTAFFSNSGFIIDPDSTANNNFSCRVGDDSGNVKGASFARPSAAAWHHYCIVFDRSVSNGVSAAYVDGASQSLTNDFTQALGTANFGNNTLYFMSRGGTALFGAGKLAEVAVWTVKLSANEAKALSLGAYPMAVNNANLLNYWPLWGLHSPELEFSNNNTATVHGAAQDNHAPVKPFSSRFWRAEAPPGAAAASAVPYDVPHSPQHQAIMAM